MISPLKNSILILITIAGLLAVTTGCGNNDSLGEGIPSHQPKIDLAEVVQTPQKYHEKTFVVDGTVTSQCASLCDFVLTDGTHSVTIYSQDFKFPKLAIGKKVTVFVQATAGERLILSALGMQLG